MRIRLDATLAAMLAACTLAGCSDGVDMLPGVFFPTVPRGDAYPQALLADVTLVERSGCLLLERPSGEPILPLWPEGYRPVRANEGIQVLDEDGEVVVASGGERVSFGGGFGGLRWASATVGGRIPERCRLSRDSYFIMSPFS